MSRVFFLIVMLIVMAIAIAWGALGTPVLAGEVMVAVAANFLNPVKEIGERFQQDRGHRLVLVPGSSGKLYAQIRNGAPFEVFLSADSDRPRLLDGEGLAVKGTRFTYAIGRLVLWSKDPKLIGTSGAVVLQTNDFTHVAIANPKTAPYGLAAVQVLGKLGLWKTLQSRLVQGEDIAQTFQYVVSGNAELGFVALSQILDPRVKGTGSWWEIPRGWYEPLKQDAVLLNPGQNNPAAREFLDYLKRSRAQEILKRYRYGIGPS